MSAWQVLMMVIAGLWGAQALFVLVRYRQISRNEKARSTSSRLTTASQRPR